jgi:hypothetical protein
MGGWITEPVMGYGLRSGDTWSFGERGREWVMPGGARRGSPLVHVEHLEVREEADAHLIARRLSFGMGL